MKGLSHFQIASLVILFTLVIGGFLLGLQAVGAQETAIDMESSVRAQWEANQVIHSNAQQQVRGLAQVAQVEASQIRQLYDSVVKGRVSGGEAFKAFREANPSMDPKVYGDLKRVIETSANKFAGAQIMLTSKQQEARNYFGSTNFRFFQSVGFGIVDQFPTHISPQDHLAPSDTDGDGKLTIFDYRAVTLSKTRNAFETGTDEPMDVFAP